jgi:hypothetical protein
MSGWLLAQALVERSLLDSVAAGIGTVRYRLDGYVGQGNSKYLLIAAAACLLWFLLRRRR